MASDDYHHGTDFRHGTEAITILSAALTLVNFVSTHGRLPKARECFHDVSSGLLLNRGTYTKVFGVSTFAQVLCAFSSVVSAVTWYTCLGHGCTHRFPRVQSDIRLCQSCRTKKTADDPWMDGPSVHRQQLRRWGADLDDWTTSIDWEG